MKTKFLIMLATPLLLAGCSSSLDVNASPIENDQGNVNIIDASNPNDRGNKNVDPLVQLEMPGNVQYNELTNVISWDMVDNASGYQVLINTKAHVVYDLAFLVEFAFEQDFYFKVKALGDMESYTDSEYYISGKMHYTFPVEEPLDPADSVDVDHLKGGNKSYKVSNELDENGHSLLVDSFKIRKYDYFFYKVGTIHDVPLQTNATPWRYSGSDGILTKEFATTKTQTEMVSEQVIDASETCTTTNDFEQVQSGESFGFGLEGKADGGFGFNVNSSIEWSFLNVSSINSKTSFSTSVTRAVEYTLSESQTTTYQFSPDYSEDGYYRYVLMGDIDVFVCEVYSRSDNSLMTSTKYPVIAATSLELEYSPNRYFSRTVYEDIDFIKDENAEYVSPTKDLSEQYLAYIDQQVSGSEVSFFEGFLRIDLSKAQSTGTIESITYGGYDYYKNGVLTINPLINGKPIYEVQIIGSKVDKDGFASKTINNLAIYFPVAEWNVVPTITLKDISFVTGLERPTLDVTNLVNAEIYIEGDVTISGSNTKQTSVIKGKDITINGDTNASLTVNQSFTASINDVSCISANTLTINGLILNAKSANGQNGANGTSYDVNAKECSPRNGGTGADGIKGGHIFTSDKLIINNSKLELTTGNGGNAGKGGNGEGSSSGVKLHVGGTGGKGGNGANAGTALNIKDGLSLNNSLIKVTLGNGGNSGQGGLGGNGQYYAVGCVGQGGKGGASGNGGNSGTFLEVKEGLEIHTNNYQIIVNPGKGGNASNGGNAGKTDNNWFCKVAGSDGGNAGKGGNCLIGGENILTIYVNGNMVSGQGGQGGNSSYGNTKSLDGTSGSGNASGSVIYKDLNISNKGSAGIKGNNKCGGLGGNSVTVEFIEGIPQI